MVLWFRAKRVLIMEVAMDQKGMMLKIQRFCLNDGPGIRTTLFLKGCSLKCLWCANPESQDKNPVLQFNKILCDGCAMCERVCTRGAIQLVDKYPAIDRKRCVACGMCAESCTRLALCILGKEMTTKELLAMALKDVSFYEEGGGVTFSGGEPLTQADFLLEAVIGLKERGIHTVLDTSGYGKWQDLQRMVPFFDAIYFDLKHMDEEEHCRLTGLGNTIIKENCRRLCEQGARVYLRFPLIPGYNDSKENLKAMALFINSLSAYEELHILPYHKFGVSKYCMIDMECIVKELKSPTQKQIMNIADFFHKQEIRVRIMN